MTAGAPPEDYERAACGLLTTATNGTILRVNATLCAWTGYAADELASRRFQDLLTVGSKLFHQTHWMPLLQMQGSVAEVQLEMVHRDGRVFAVLVNAARRGQASGAGDAGEAMVDVAVFVATDRRKYERELLLARRRAEELLASEREAQEARARAEEALRQREREARQRAEFAEQLIGIVSHDLRNPLQAVLLGARLLGSIDLGAHARTVGRIASSAERANRLITDLLDFTQARLGGGLPVAPRAIDPHALVADCLEEVRLAWPGRMLEHRRVGPDDAVGDPDRLAQVVSNLVNNALTYGAADEPVTITSAVGEGSFEIRVHNGGRPIPAALQEQVFEPMRRGEQHVRLGSRSVGIGLYIVRAIAEAHGGGAHVRSTEAEGTTFVVTVPRPARPPTTPGDFP